MPTLRQRVANALLGDERKQLQSAIESLAEMRHYVRSPAALAEQLMEVDSQLVDLLIQQAGYTRIGGPGGYAGLAQLFSETQRRNVVVDCRWMYHMDVLTAAAVDMWTDFGFGQHVSVTPTDEMLAEIWDEFFSAPRNRPVLGDAQVHENSNKVIVDGEVFLAVWVSTLDGQCTIRRIETDQITDIICDLDDPDVPVWYVQSTLDRGTIYYADWRATPDQLDRSKPPEGARLADSLREATRVVIVPAQRNRIGKRGWPQLRQTVAWARAYRDFIGDRATIAKKAALRVEKITARNAGQRQIDSIVSQMQSSLVSSGYGRDTNQNTAAAQTWVQNDNVNLEWMNRDTGAAAAQIDGLTIAAQFAAGAGVPLHWLGRADAMQNRAVAKESSLPWYERIQRYQTFWTSVFSDLVEVVGRMENQYGSESIEDFTCEVGLDSPFQNDIDEIASIMGAITAAVSGGTLDAGIAGRANQEFTRLALLSLGIRDADGIVEPPEDGESAVGDETGMPTEAAIARLEKLLDGIRQMKELERERSNGHA